MRRPAPRLWVLAPIALTIMVIGGALVTGSFSTEVPTGPQTGGHPGQIAASPQNNPPVKHVIILVKENHSFDNLFGQLPGVDGTTTAEVGGKIVKLNITPDRLKSDIYHNGEMALIATDHRKMNSFSKQRDAIQDGKDVADSSTPHSAAGFRTYSVRFNLRNCRPLFLNDLRVQFP